MAETIRLENLKLDRQRILRKIERQLPIYHLSQRIYYKHKATYNMLLQDYERLDYRMAELDGRMTKVTISSHKPAKDVVASFKKKFGKMDDRAKEDFINSLK